jgi:hypothetical protein
VCEGLDGMCFEEDPTPIHEWCDCEVNLGERHRSYTPPDGERECGDNQWELDFRQSVWPAPGNPNLGPVLSWWDLIIHCWDGETLTVEVEIDHGDGTDPDVIEDEAWNELYDTAEDIASTECRKCDPPRVS